MLNRSFVKAVNLIDLINSIWTLVARLGLSLVIRMGKMDLKRNRIKKAVKKVRVDKNEKMMGNKKGKKRKESKKVY
jgi:hypothetical protein